MIRDNGHVVRRASVSEEQLLLPEHVASVGGEVGLAALKLANRHLRRVVDSNEGERNRLRIVRLGYEVSNGEFDLSLIHDPTSPVRE